MKEGVTLIPPSGHLKQSIFYRIVFVALSLFMFCFLVLENIENIKSTALARKQNVLLPGVQKHYLIALVRKQNLLLSGVQKHYLIALIRKQNVLLPSV